MEWYALDGDDDCPCEELPPTLEVFDLTCEDALPGDDEWTQNYVRVLEHRGWEEDGVQSYSSFEVVLDSGADVSVMPESWLHMGIGKATSEGQVQMRDAQGGEMPSLGTRLITLDMGPACIQERFHASTVGSPLLSLGRLLKQVWTLDHRNNTLCLCNEDVAVPVNFKKNSLTVQASVFAVNMSPIEPQQDQPDETLTSHVRPLLEGKRTFVEFATDPDTWSAGEEGKTDELGHQWKFMLNGDPFCLCDSTLHVSPAPLMGIDRWKYRTTVVKIAGRWELVELQQDLTKLDELEESLPGVLYATKTLTMIQRRPSDPKDFGMIVLEDQSPPPLASNPAPHESRLPTELQADEGMADDANLSEHGEAEVTPAAPGIELQGPVPEEVEVEGRRLSFNSTAAELKLVCKTLGIGSSGSKTVLYKRIAKHVWRRKLEDELALQEAASLPVRAPKPEPVPHEPSPEEVAKHRLTHVPYQPWCPLCVSTRARRDGHREGGEAHRSEGSWPVMSLDLMYSSVEGDALECMRTSQLKSKEGKMMVLVCVDRATGMLHGVPLPSKEQQCLQYAAKEVLSFLAYLGRTEVEIRGDNEPSMTMLLDKIVTARTAAKLATRKAPSQPHEHQTNGAAEQAILSLRDIGSTLLQQVRACGYVLSNESDLVPWVYPHAATLHNQYAVTAGTTPYERAFGVQYRGKLAMWGETVYFSLAEPHRRKGKEKFVKGIFLGKSMQNDLNVCGTALGIYLSSTIRRLPESQQWDRILLKEFKGKPWRYGLAGMGLKVIPGMKERVPQPAVMLDPAVPVAPAPSAPPPPPVVGEGPADEAASDPESSASSDKMTTDSEKKAEPHEDRKCVRTEEEDETQIPKEARASGSVMETGGEESLPEALPESKGEKRLQAPPFYAGVESPSKRVRAVKVGDAEYYVGDEDLDDWWNMIEFDARYFEEDDWMDYSPENDPEKLWEDQEESDGPPVLSPEQLEEVEIASRRDELQRLLEMSVLEAMDEAVHVPKEKLLKTRHVYDWRYRSNKWQRRARLVCKELKAWSPFRQDTYAPSTCPSMLRVLPHMFVSTPGYVLRSFDVKDAFLTVDQKEELFVELNGAIYKVKKCLPGQQLAPVHWHDQLSEDLARCNLKSNVACPVVYGGEKLGATIHVDDGLLGGYEERVNTAVSILQQKYRLEVSPVVKNIGDQLKFLKRTLEVVEDGLKIHIDAKYVEKVVSILAISNPRHRKVPTTHDLTMKDESEYLDEAHVGRYRAALGCLLYISPERPDIQHCVGVLARGMSKPTVKQLKHLKYLTEYLYATRDYCLVLRWSRPGRSVMEESLRSQPKAEDDERTGDERPARLLEAISDSDWASSADRKSISCGHLYLDGNLMFSYSRRQCSISLSSCEAELISATSAIAEALFLKNSLESLSDLPVDVVVRLDNSAARSLLVKCGVSRIRHLDCRLLWCQGLVKSGHLSVKPIAGLQNPSDIATKVLSSERIKYLLGLAGMYNNDGLIKSTKPPQTAKVQRIASRMDIENLVRTVVYAAIALSQQHHVGAAVMTAGSAAETISEGAAGALNSENLEVTWYDLVATIWNLMLYRGMSGLMATNLMLYRIMDGLLVTSVTNEGNQGCSMGSMTCLLLFLLLFAFASFSMYWTWGRYQILRSPQTTTRSPQTTTRSPQTTTRSPQTTTRSPQTTTRSAQSTATGSEAPMSVTPPFQNRAERDAALREEKARFVQTINQHPEIFSAQMHEPVVYTRCGEYYHGGPMCHGLRNHTGQLTAGTVREALIRRMTPCKLCCNDHWMIYGEWLVQPMPGET